MASSEEAFFPNLRLSDKRAPSEEIVSLSLIRRTSSRSFFREIDAPAALEISSFLFVHELSHREEASCFANSSFDSFFDDIDLGVGDIDLGFCVMEVCPPEGEFRSILDRAIFEAFPRDAYRPSVLFLFFLGVFLTLFFGGVMFPAKTSSSVAPALETANSE